MADTDKLTRLISALGLVLSCHQRPSAAKEVRVGRPSPATTTQTSVLTDAKRLESAGMLSQTDIKILIRSFNTPGDLNAVPMGFWLPTGHTAETEVLLAHPAEAYPFLVDALHDPSVHVRRYSAFCIGELHRRDAIPELQSAIRAELARSLKAQQAGQHWPRAGLHAMLRAYAAIDRRDLITWLLSESFPEDQTAVINSELESWVLHGGPRCEALSTESCRHQWIEYWRKSSGKPDKQLFD